ncbi:MAG TPA: TspO/MBR family protein [Candidatus Paceibacterota bacterium]|nr:TspO/MBR family protein [Candidatus Paceibacterota bacterium]
MKPNDFWKLLIAIAIAELAGIVGSLFTLSAITGWYAVLVKPAFNPPSFVFGPVWSMLYFLMGIAAFLVWRKGWERKEVKIALAAFATQLVLNAFWSIIFFGLHNPLAAFIDIVLLWLAVIWTIVVFYKLSRAAAYLLLPYILWISFAAYLNFAIWRLN